MAPPSPGVMGGGVSIKGKAKEPRPESGSSAVFKERGKIVSKRRSRGWPIRDPSASGGPGP